MPLGDTVANGNLGRGERFDKYLRIRIDVDKFNVLAACGDHTVDGISAAAADADYLDLDIVCTRFEFIRHCMSSQNFIQIVIGTSHSTL